jgi:hypothetical protein
MEGTEIMRKTINAIVVATALIGGPAGAWASPGMDMAAEAPAAGSTFADLAAMGYDLGKFRPDYDGRFPYR